MLNVVNTPLSFVVPDYRTAGRAAANIEANCHSGALADIYSRISLV